MANRQKFTRGALGHMLGHFERKKDKEGNYYKFGNQDIDTSKSYLNYNLAAADQPLSQLDFIHKRMKDENIYLLNRKNVNVMMTWCITLPHKMNDASEEDKELFFKHSYEFMKDRYGKENVISAWVHQDESGQPHMHFAYTPVYYDVKKKRYSFNAKVVGSQKDLKSFHKDIDNYLTRQLGYDTGVITGETEINLTIKELKELSKRQQEIEQRIEKNIADLEEPQIKFGIAKGSEVTKVMEQNKLLTEALTLSKEQNKILIEQNERLEGLRNVQRYQQLKREYESLKMKYETLKEKIKEFLNVFKLNEKFKEFSELFRSERETKIMSVDERMIYFKRKKAFKEQNSPHEKQSKNIIQNRDIQR